jgi:hypothetical protein
MTRAAELGRVLFEQETNWGENVATMTYALPTLGPVDISGFRQTRMPSERTVQDLQEGTMPLVGPMEAEFEVRCYLPGHGSAMTGGGPFSLTSIPRFLGLILGNAALGHTAGTTATGGTTTAPTTALAAGFAAGSIIWPGTKGDGRADGQPSVLSTHAASTMNLLVALAAAMNNGDAITPSEMIYPFESPASSVVQPFRMRLMTANLQVLAHGCYAKAITFDFPLGGKPSVTVRVGCSWWEYVAATYPDVTAIDDFLPAPIAAGSFFEGNHGVTTRAAANIKAITSFSLTYQLGISEKRTPGGVQQYQLITGAVRTPGDCTFEYTEDSEAATTTPSGGGSDTQYYHGLFGWNGASSGQRGGVYFPKFCKLEEKAVQVNDNGVNRKRVLCRAYRGDTTTNDLTKSCFRIGLA